MKHHHNDFESKTRWVVYITAIVMVVEIYFGLRTGSMALLADGIHMGSHVLALGLSWFAYFMVRKLSGKENFKGDTSKILSLAGYSSGLMLLIFSFVLMWEAVHRLYNPVEINFVEALIVAVVGFFVNILSAFILKHDHHHSDNNIRAAYLHVIADALTSFTAIVGLTAAMIWNIIWLDTLGAILSSLVIIRWSVILLKDSGKDLLNL
ncbi:MAG TPA: cation transporter [Bacteroidales bacterium]|nr:cation transporter [Bacteroidales bacterium]